MLNIYINDKVYSGFTQATVYKTMANLCGYFSFSFAGTNNYKDITNILNVFDKVIIYADTLKIMTAFIEVININYDQGDYTVTISGREPTADIVDCIISGSFTQTSTTSLVTLIENIFKKEKLGEIGQDSPKTNPIKIIDKSDTGRQAFEYQDFLIADSGTSVYDMINKYALRKSCILITDENGDLVITNSGQTQIKHSLNNIKGVYNNIVNANLNIDVSKLYRNYSYLQVANYTNQLSSSKEPKDLSNISFKSQDDTNIRQGRNYLNVADDVYTYKKLQELTRWRQQTNITNARVYTAELNGHTFDKNSTLILSKDQSKNYEPTTIKLNDLMKIQDEYCGVSDNLIVNELTYKMSLESGNTLNIGFVNKFAYSLLAEDAILNNAFYNPSNT